MSYSCEKITFYYIYRDILVSVKIYEKARETVLKRIKSNIFISSEILNVFKMFCFVWYNGALLSS